MQVVRHSATRHEVVGVIAVVAGRLAQEPYSRVHATNRAAQADRDRWERVNVAALQDLAASRAARLVVATNYLAARRMREGAQQLVLL